MSRAIWLPALTALVLLAACTGRGSTESPPPPPLTEDPNATAVAPADPGGTEAPENPYAPAKGDESLTRGQVYIDSTDIMTLESFPPQFRLQVRGSLPTPCNQLRAVVDEPNEQNEIHVEMYSLVDPGMACTQVLEPFEASLSLGSDFAGDSYTVFLNGEQVGEISPIPPTVPVTPEQ